MPETDQASQFITALEPFYKVAYAKGEKSPPIFNIFCKKNDHTPVIKMNGHASPLKDIGDNHKLNTSHASMIHNISGTSCNGQSNNDNENTGISGSSLSNGDINGVVPREIGKTLVCSLLFRHMECKCNGDDKLAVKEVCFSSKKN